MTQPTVLVYHADPKYTELVRVPRARVVVRAAATPSEAAELIADTEILYAWKFPPHLLAKATRLRWLQAMGAGVVDGQHGVGCAVEHEHRETPQRLGWGD